MKPREFNGEYQLRSGFEEFNESKMCGNIKRKREIRWAKVGKKSWHGNILTGFGILTISFYSNIGLT